MKGLSSWGSGGHDTYLGRRARNSRRASGNIIRIRQGGTGSRDGRPGEGRGPWWRPAREGEGAAGSSSDRIRIRGGRRLAGLRREGPWGPDGKAGRAERGDVVGGRSGGVAGGVRGGGVNADARGAKKMLSYKLRFRKGVSSSASGCVGLREFAEGAAGEHEQGCEARKSSHGSPSGTVQ
jgi:hypothetical protein